MTFFEHADHRVRLSPIWPFLIWILVCHGMSSAKADDPVVTVGVYENAPKVFVSESGEPAGIFIDIIEHIAEREDWTLRYVFGTWAEGLDLLAKGDIDLMPDAAITNRFYGLVHAQKHGLEDTTVVFHPTNLFSRHQHPAPNTCWTPLTTIF